METDSANQRQIELQSPEDLSYLLANVRRAAQGHLDEAFPPMEGDESDTLRTQIEAYINEYINKTFTHAAPNLSINGMPAEPKMFLSSADGTTNGGSLNPSEPQIEYEPWDGRLRQRVEDLARQEEELLNEIAALKKSVPSHMAAEHARVFADAAARDEEAMRERVARDKEEAEALMRGSSPPGGAETGDDEEEDEYGNSRKRKGGVLLDVEVLERQEDVERAHRDAVEGLSRVKREMPSTVARMERARQAGEYFVTRRS